MKYKALVSFCGAVSMHTGEIRELDNKKIIADLLKAGYIEKIAENANTEPEKRKKNEGKRINAEISKTVCKNKS